MLQFVQLYFYWLCTSLFLIKKWFFNWYFINLFFDNFRRVWSRFSKNSRHKRCYTCFNSRNCWHNNVRIRWILHERFKSHSKCHTFCSFSDFSNFLRFRFFNSSIRSYHWLHSKSHWDENVWDLTKRHSESTIYFCHLEVSSHEWSRYRESDLSSFFSMRWKRTFDSSFLLALTRNLVFTHRFDFVTRICNESSLSLISQY